MYEVTVFRHWAICYKGLPVIKGRETHKFLETFLHSPKPSARGTFWAVAQGSSPRLRAVVLQGWGNRCQHAGCWGSNSCRELSRGGELHREGAEDLCTQGPLSLLPRARRGLLGVKLLDNRQRRTPEGRRVEWGSGRFLSAGRPWGSDCSERSHFTEYPRLPAEVTEKPHLKRAKRAEDLNAHFILKTQEWLISLW